MLSCLFIMMFICSLIYLRIFIYLSIHPVSHNLCITISFSCIHFPPFCLCILVACFLISLSVLHPHTHDCINYLVFHTGNILFSANGVSSIIYSILCFWLVITALLQQTNNCIMFDSSRLV